MLCSHTPATAIFYVNFCDNIYIYIIYYEYVYSIHERTLNLLNAEVTVRRFFYVDKKIAMRPGLLGLSELQTYYGCACRAM